MTTIALDENGLLAGDTQSSTDFVCQDKTKKIIRKEGRVFAVAGNYAQGLAVIDWLLGNKRPHFNCDDFVVAEFIGEVAQVYANEFYPYEAEPPFAFGSGGVFAMAAMLGGADAKRAVEIAARLDEHTGTPVKTLNLREV